MRLLAKAQVLDAADLPVFCSCVSERHPPRACRRLISRWASFFTGRTLFVETSVIRFVLALKPAVVVRRCPPARSFALPYPLDCSSAPSRDALTSCNPPALSTRAPLPAHQPATDLASLMLVHASLRRFHRGPAAPLCFGRISQGPAEVRVRGLKKID